MNGRGTTETLFCCFSKSKAGKHLVDPIGKEIGGTCLSQKRNRDVLHVSASFQCSKTNLDVIVTE